MTRTFSPGLSGARVVWMEVAPGETTPADDRWLKAVITWLEACEYILVTLEAKPFMAMTEIEQRRKRSRAYSVKSCPASSTHNLFFQQGFTRPSVGSKWWQPAAVVLIVSVANLATPRRVDEVEVFDPVPIKRPGGMLMRDKVVYNSVIPGNMCCKHPLPAPV